MVERSRRSTGDAEYLAAMATGIEEALSRFDPQIVFYLAGADPFIGDLIRCCAPLKIAMEWGDI